MACQSEPELEALARELVDKYGSPPASVSHQRNFERLRQAILTRLAQLRRRASE